MASEGEGVIEKIRMVLDEASAQALEKGGQNAINKATDPAKATRNLSLVEKATNRVKTAITAAVASFALFFSATAVFRFFKDAYETANEAEAVWSRLGATLRGVGVEFKDVRGEIEANARELQRLTTMGDEDFADTLTTLIQYSRDYEKSLAAVSVVADLAAAKQIDFRTAADLVGKAMIGQSGTLLRYGIVVEKGADAVEVMRAQFAGMAGAEADTFEGSIRQRENAIGDLKETVGGFFQLLLGGSETIDGVTSSVQSLDGALQNNTGVIRGIIRYLRVLVAGWISWVDVLKIVYNVISLGIKGPWFGLANVIKGISVLLLRLVEGTQKLARAVGLDAMADGLEGVRSRMQAAVDIWDDYAAAAAESLRKTGTRIDELATGALARLRNAVTLPDATGSVSDTPLGVGGRNPEEEKPPKPKKPPKEKTADELFQERIDLLSRAAEFETTRAGAAAELMAIERQLADELASGNASFEERIVLEERLAQVREAIAVAKPAEKMSEMTKMIVEDAQLVTDALMNMGKGSGDSVLQAIAKIAKGEALHDAVRVIQQLGFAAFQSAMGNAAGASKHLKAAALFAKSAAAWGAVSMAGGGGGSSGGAGAAAGGAGGASATSEADRAGRVGNELHIHVDGFNPNRPDHVRLLGDGVREVVEQFGGGVFVNGARTN